MNEAHREWLRCGGVPLLCNMSAPPRTEVNYRTKSVFGSAMISLHHWLLFRKHLEGSFKDTNRLLAFFGGDTEDAVLNKLKELGTTPETSSKTALGPTGVLIGLGGKLRDHGGQWVGSKACGRHWDYLCDDLDVIVSVLSRLVGNLYLSSRSADYSWEALVESYFIVDDPRISRIEAPVRIHRAR